MEGVATTAYTGLKSYWRRKGYLRLNQNQNNNNNNKRRRFNIPKPKLKLGRFRFRVGVGSVRRFFLKIRDAYVNAMLGFANKGMIYGGGVVEGGYCSNGRVKEYDEKMLVEIYKRMVLTKQQNGIAVVGGRRVASVVAPMSGLM